MLTALALRQRGYAVTLVERQSAGRESSWAGGGILSPLYPWHYPQAVNALAQRSQQLYPALAQSLLAETGIDAELLGSGLLMLDDVAGQESAAGTSASKALDPLSWAVDCGADLARIDAGEIKAVQGGIGMQSASAWWMPQVMQVRNPRLLRALRAALDVHGVRLLEQAELENLEIIAGRVCGGRISGRRMAFDALVLSAGAWSAQVLQGMDLATPSPPAIEPVRGQMMVLNAPGSGLQRIVMAQGRYLIPRKDGRILVGSTVEYAGFDKTTTADAREALLAFAHALFPALRPAPVEAHWAGLRPGSPQGVPYIDRHPQLANLYIHAGHFRNGLVMGPASTELLLQRIEGESSGMDASPYAWDGERQGKR